MLMEQQHDTHTAVCNIDDWMMEEEDEEVVVHDDVLVKGCVKEV